MIRTNKEIGKVDLIIVSDIHLREDIPICRTDDFIKAQWDKLDFISELQKEHNCPVVHGGDLFHHWKPSPFLLSETIKHLPDQFYTVYGNHDLPQHNIELKEKCGIYTLEQAGKLKVLEGVHWGQLPKKASITVTKSNGEKSRILVWHVFTYKGKEPWPGCTAPKGAKLLKKYPTIDLIITGDNHQPFIEEYDDRLLINPGSLSRQRSSEIHKPRVYLWNADTNIAIPVFLPIEQDVISREHLEKEEQKNSRIDAFVSSLNNDWDVQLSFEDNIEAFEKKNKVHKSVMEIIYKSLEV